MNNPAHGLLVILVMITQLAGGQSIPTISSFSPSSGPAGTTVTITGTNFSSTAANNTVYFGATRATVSNATSTSLQVSVPTGATYQPITVNVNGMTAFSSVPFRTTFSFSGTIGGSLTNHTDLIFGAQVKESVVADFDNDGKPDIAAVDQGSNFAFVYGNHSSTGTLSFDAMPYGLAAGVGPYAIQAADLDGDGKPEVIIANMYAASIQIFQNLSTTPGTLSFTNPFSFDVAPDPSFIAINDIDLDGKPDIAVTCSNGYGDGVVSILKNTSVPGSFSFAGHIDIPAGSGGLWGVALNDVDGDGKPDMTVSSGGTGQVSIFRNIGTPGPINLFSFAPKVSFTTGGYPAIVSWADFDGDSKPDLLVGANSVQLFRNLSAPGSFDSNSLSAPTVLGTPNGSWNPTPGDFDGDGKLDIAVRDVNGIVDIYKNNCSPGTISTNSFSLPYTVVTGGAPLSLAAADMDGDGLNDLVLSNEQTQMLSVFRNANNPQKAPPSHLTFSNITQISLDGSFVASPDSPDGYVVVRRMGSWSAPLVNGTTYSAGQTIGSDSVVMLGSATTFHDVELTAGMDAYYTCYAYYGSGASIQYVSSNASIAKVFIPGFDLGPVVTVTPSNFTLDDEITITFDAKKSFPLNDLVGASSIQFYSGVITESPSSGNWNLNYTNTYSQMTNLGNNLWSITFVPRTFYNFIPENLTVYRLAMVFFDNQGHRGTSFDGHDVYLTVSVKQNQTIAMDLIETKTLGDAPFNISASASSGLPVYFYSSDDSKASITGNTVTIHNPGFVTITAVQNGDIHYNAADPVGIGFCINPAKPVITMSGTNTSSVHLTSSSTTGNQWYLNGDAITNATFQTMLVNAEGVYTVEATVDGCHSELSDEFPIVVTGDIDPHAGIEVYPTLARDRVYIKNMTATTPNPVVLDLTGRVVTPEFTVDGTTGQLDVRALSSGMYILKFPGEFTKAVRFVKE